MGFSFRKSKKIGLFRVSVGKRGLSASVGVKGARIRANTRGQVYGSVGAGGMRYEKRLNSGRGTGATAPPASSGLLSGCVLALLGSGGLLVLLIVACGLLGSLPSERSLIRTASEPSLGTPAQQTLVAAPPATADDSDVEVLEAVAVEPENSADTQNSVPTPPAGEEATGESEPRVATTLETPEQARGPPAAALPKQEKRTWTDAAGTHSVVATLVGYKDGYVQLERADNERRVALPVAKLSEKDQQFVAYATTPRHRVDAELLIGRVSRVLDGDTLQINDLATGAQTVRLEGIDAPEKDQRFGEEARRWLAHEVSGKGVRVEVTTGKDRYERKLGHVYVGDRWLNFELVKAGLAWQYVEYSDDVRLAAVQHDARTAGRGLWQDARRVAPWDWRNGQRVETALPVNRESSRETDATVYITKTGSKYHRAGCQYLSKSSSPIPLSRAVSACSPCSRCKPPTQ